MEKKIKLEEPLQIIDVLKQCICELTNSIKQIQEMCTMLSDKVSKLETRVKRLEKSKKKNGKN